MKKSIFALAIAISSFSPLLAMQHHYSGDRNADNWQKNSCRGANLSESEEDYDDSDRRYNQRRNKFDRAYFERKEHASRQSADNSRGNRDDFIAKQIDNTLASGWFSKGYDNVSYDVDNGQVILSGDVKTLDEKIKIEKEVAKIEGIKSIDNEIVVNDMKSSGRSDEEIGQEIFNTLKSGWFSKGYDKVTFEINNGRVMLLGRVEKLDDKNNIEKSLRKIEGIREINNQIAIAGEKSSDNMVMRSDKEIDKDIKNMIKSNASGKESDKIAFAVNNGVVTITGSVNSANDKMKIEKKLLKINGIKKIDNRLTVNEKETTASE